MESNELVIQGKVKLSTHLLNIAILKDKKSDSAALLKQKELLESTLRNSVHSKSLKNIKISIYPESFLIFSDKNPYHHLSAFGFSLPTPSSLISPNRSLGVTAPNNFPLIINMIF